MTMLVVCTVALLASGLTFFSGFGLGTLLLPVFAFFFPLEEAIALTAVVHFLNGLFKLALVGRHVDRGVILRFGLPAIAAAFVGARALHALSGLAGPAALRAGRPRAGRHPGQADGGRPAVGLRRAGVLAALRPPLLRRALAACGRGAQRLLRRPVGHAGGAALGLPGAGRAVQGGLRGHRRRGVGADRLHPAGGVRPHPGGRGRGAWTGCCWGRRCWPPSPARPWATSTSRS